jgi:Kef-type K+ transport system membrane component KefB
VKESLLQDPLILIFLQTGLILVTARVCGALARKAGQPAVIGEMVAGILLGPSLLGRFWPELFSFFFPAFSFGTLGTLSQIGVCLFMFVIGMELDLDQLKQQARTAVLVSQASILLPFLLGVAVSLFLFPAFAAPGTACLALALFLGISMSITAFPVLARILEERRLTKTALGSTAIACAATNDVAAWSMLAVVVSIVRAGGVAASVLRIGLVVLFVAVLLFWLKPRILRWVGGATFAGGVRGKTLMAGVLVFLITSALVTDLMGVHALFGSFLAGVVMPRCGGVWEVLNVRLERFGSAFLVPLFFAFTGLRTNLGLLNDTGTWLICLGLILVATLGKLGGTMVSARLAGVNWIDSFSLGALMNTRGLVELIALNMGYDLGILSTTIFTMLVIMALVTTCLTGPLLSLGDYLRTRKGLAIQPI